MSAKEPVETFAEALGADVVIPNVTRRGALSIAEILESREWYRRYRASQRKSGSSDDHLPR